MTTAELLDLLPEYAGHTEREILDQSLTFGWAQFIHKGKSNWFVSWDDQSILPGVYKTKQEATEAMARANRYTYGHVGESIARSAAPRSGAFGVS